MSTDDEDPDKDLRDLIAKLARWEKQLRPIAEEIKERCPGRISKALFLDSINEARVAMAQVRLSAEQKIHSSGGFASALSMAKDEIVCSRLGCYLPADRPGSLCDYHRGRVRTAREKGFDAVEKVRRLLDDP